LSLETYQMLFDNTGRLFCQGKATVSAEVARIFERLGLKKVECCLQLEALAMPDRLDANRDRVVATPLQQLV
jgi:hypothetical protein